ncbi:MAG: amidohydrolase family protein [Alphaproteobacteria bacterium]|nr:amidohydrolase family protein [Alphaproteobacteria bacterium]
MTETLEVERLLAAPGHLPAARDVRLTFEKGLIARIEETQSPCRNGRIALPAMVNAHDHGYGIRPPALGGSDDALECWIASFSRATIEPRLEAAVAFGRMALAGIGATVHCHNSLVADNLESEAAGVALAAADVGIRIAFSCPVRDRNPWVYGDQHALLPYLPPDDRAGMEAVIADTGPALHLVEQVEAVAAAHETETFQVQYGPIGPQWCHDTTLELIAEASAANDRRVHMHLLESRRQREWLDATYPQGIVRFLDDIGLLSPRLTLAHGVHLTDDECALLAERGVTVAVNTSSNLRMRSGVAPVARFMQHGLRFGFGRDGCAHDDDQDYFRDLRLAWRLHNGTGLEPAFPPGRLFDAACRNGFRSIDGSDDYGEVARGARADLVVLDYAGMREDYLISDEDELDVVLTRATSHHVQSLLVAGHGVVSDGALTGLDLDDAERELTKSARRVAAMETEQAGRNRRRRDAVRAYYAGGRHP